MRQSPSYVRHTSIHDLKHSIFFKLILFEIFLVNVQLVECIIASTPLNGLQRPCDKSRRVFVESYGEISDGPAGSNYTQDSHCEWLIKAANNSQFITLTFRSMGTECSYDYVFVYDGDSFRSPLLGSFSGKTEPQQVVATSGSMLILLYSDTNYVLDGFKAEFSVTNCLNNCTNRGKCYQHQCICHGDWIGRDCSLNACPEYCGKSKNRGFCRRDHCECTKGFSGQSCSLAKHNPPGNQWHWLSNYNGGLSPRAAHTAIYVDETDSLYVFGGYDLNNILGTLQIYRFDKNAWYDEWEVKLRSRYFPKNVDSTLLRAVLHANDEEAETWGLKKQASLFRNILISLSADSNRTTPRSQRSIYIDTDDDYQANYDSHDLQVRPSARYGHSGCKYKVGFAIYGGKLESGNLSDELWVYNVSQNLGKWTIRATNSSLKPPALTRHTLTLVDDYLYLFGGSADTGEFSSRLFKIKLSDDIEQEQWEEIIPRGGKVLDLRVVAHTTVYHKTSESLLVYGGVVAGVARFSKLSDRMFAFHITKKFWTEIFYPRTPLRDAHIPRERAFHSTTIVGNYLIVFGGYSHRHNKEEICYDNQMYLYHLGCHIWINQDVLGINHKSIYPKQQGVFAHAATLRYNHTLLIVGGYHGNVNGDLLAYTLPAMFIVNDEEVFDAELACQKHGSVTECLSDPECGWCSVDAVCYGRTIGANCTTNLQTTRCPGICPALGDCHSCLVHGSEITNSISTHSVATKLGLGQCIWCVQNARCNHKDDNYGVCGEDTPSQDPGWWGSKGTVIVKPAECTELDRRPGLTFIKYLHPINWTMPDHVTIVNATMVDFNVPFSTTQTENAFNGEMVARLLGFVRPPASWADIGEKLQVCASYSQAILKLSKDENIKTTQLAANISSEQMQCTRADWPSLEPVRIMVDFQAKRTLWIGSNNHHYLSKMGLQHNKSQETAKAFTFEYLEPYSHGTCSLYTNCIHCLSDSLCGWCDMINQCISRLQNEVDVCKNYNDEWKYLILQPSQCPNCSNFISCEQCINSELCEWWVEDARCSRKGRSELAVKQLDQCPPPCTERKNCSVCLEERGRCVWCEATQQCFSFSVYTSEYQFGLCREWIDQVVPLTDENNVNSIIKSDKYEKQQCKSCSSFTNCTSCLRSLGCGWCFDRDKPISGVCMQGDFNRSNSDCGLALSTSNDEVEWAYAQCPDVDECGLGLHDCHKEAKCTNTHGSYNCHCRRGFIGDGRLSCTRTCYDVCVHGTCQGAPDYTCNCNLGWTGTDCSINCLCNNHSTCNNKIGECDLCQNWTEGSFCERCRPGSYGNATSIEGCSPCECNDHGNIALGVCDVQTGECYCQDNTVGLRCEICDRDYYGDPRDGGQCYYQCTSRGLLKDTGKQGIGSYQRHKPLWGGMETKECLWIISPHLNDVGSFLKDSLIQLHIEEKDLNVPCDENSIYIYDGLPDLTGGTQQSQLLAVFCSEDNSPRTVESRSGHMTVHYKQGSVGQGFNAIYNVYNCGANTCHHPRKCNDKGKCVCPNGFSGPDCSYEKCPDNCNAHNNQGICDPTYGRCLCQTDYGGPDCSLKTANINAIFTDLFNSQLLSESLEHLRKTLPRFGHSLIADRRGSLWMFGGYSLSHASLNDIRQFDTKNNTWNQVTIESTPDARMPDGRYFHAAEIAHSKQIVYIYGGLSSRGQPNSNQPNKVLDDFWQFELQNQKWNEIKITEVKPPPLTGHSMTLIKLAEKEVLFLLGGFSINNSLNNEMFEYNIETNEWNNITTNGPRPIAIYGHTAVFHSPSQYLYVFGGYEFIENSIKMSNNLYGLHYPTLIWTELPTFPELNPPSDLLPRARFLHSAIITENYMLIYGGKTNPSNSSDVLIAYVYKCNQWVRLTEDVRTIGNLPTASYAQAMAYDSENSAIYIVGGWDGSAKSRVTRINLPLDICELWSSGKYLCRHFMGCSYCYVKPIIDEDSSHCYSSGRTNVCNPHNGTLLVNNGVPCDANWIETRNCSIFNTCTSCMASWPLHPEKSPVCEWCSNCDTNGKCIPVTTECKSETECSKNIVENVNACPSLICHAFDCQTCIEAENCTWANNGTIWECMEKDLVKDKQFVTTNTCPTRCSAYQNCSSCVSGLTPEERGLEDCRWSTQLSECISSYYQPLYCVGGVCGLVLTSKDAQNCPEPCQAYTQCFTCLKHAHCGWCSRLEGDGEGVCTEGSLESPTEYPAASTCDIIFTSRMNLTAIDPKDTFSWQYVDCPREDECKNQHHTCDSKSEICVDLERGYKCECAVGFKLDDEKCMPVCTQGCVRGVCVEPDVCNCEFGYVGGNCSIQCQCNGHSNCRSPDKLDDCLECHNNTMGLQCDKCKPLFVGDPKNNGECVPCQVYCYGHSDACVPNDVEGSIKSMSRLKLETYLTEGPVSDATCLRCANKTAGDRCETCVIGHFRGTENNNDGCRPCECHGHGDICDPVTGEKCNCGNNTESDASCSSNAKGSHQCWMFQCSKCKDSYAGNPVDGHQCYKQITVESKMCFDAKTIDECKIIPTSLKPGQTVFFVIQPRFLNVDIRIIVDVTQGELDIYMSSQDDSFVIMKNQSTGNHNIFLDNRYLWVADTTSSLINDLPPINESPLKLKHQENIAYSNEHKWVPNIHDCKSLNGTGFYVKDSRASDLNTYVTLNKCNTLLRVVGLKNRIILTLPQNAHNLNGTKFYIALRATSSSYGLVFFRQDQLHIDLFVFFSVFFSCFFLFLALCVVAWKAKQTADIRRARRRQVVEMYHMAKRPFASVLLLVSSETESSIRNRAQNSKFFVNNHNIQDVKPVAIEPTADGAAAVSTVFVRLPGKYKTPITLALASTLTAITRQYPYSGRAFLRRRGSHHALPPSNLN